MSAVRPGWHYPRLVAHRGGGVLAPENTFAGLRAAQKYGYKAVEFDVMLTSDHVPVLVHDETFGRTLGGSGSVPRTPFNELRRMDAGSWFSARFAGEPVPALADVLSWLQTHGMWANVEIKPARGFAAVTGSIVAGMVQQYYPSWPPRSHLVPAPLLSSFSVDALAAARSVAPGIPRALLVTRVPTNWQALLEKLECVALHCDHRYLEAPTVERVVQAGYGLMCYTVNRMRRARQLFAQGAHAICTDRLDLFADYDSPTSSVRAASTQRKRLLGVRSR